MTLDPGPPSWKLPRGVNASLWRYAHTERLAAEDDSYFAGHPLFATDREVVDARFTEAGPLIDLGCGTGRLALHFARRGFDVTAIDLSPSMLRVAAAKARADGLRLNLLQVNLCDLGCFPASTFAYALSMFSTLGMIRGSEARSEALREACRVLRPGGRLALHSHNLWLNLGDSQGRSWLLGQVSRALLGRPGFGDRRMTYRGIPGMEVHLFRWPELRRLLCSAGFVIDEVVPIDAVRARPIPAPWLAPGLRAGGWIVFAHKPANTRGGGRDGAVPPHPSG